MGICIGSVLKQAVGFELSDNPRFSNTGGQAQKLVIPFGLYTKKDSGIGIL